MTTRENYINEIQIDINAYKEKMSKIENVLKNNDSDSNPELTKYMDAFEDKFDKASSMLEKIKFCSEMEYGEIKDNASEVFKEVKKAFHAFSSFLTMDQLYHVKDEIIDFSSEKLGEAQELLKKHPVAAAASALTLGFVIGALFTRSR